MPLVFTTSYIDDARAIFRYYKKLADGAVAQVSDSDLTRTLDPEMNSIAIVMKHMAGNMLSRWTDFLTSDGEKPTRNRDGEFEGPPASREELLALWERGWAALFAALDGLTDADLTRTVMIRGEAHSVMQAINRQVAHLSYHCGQIVMLAKHFKGAQWKSLSIPRGQSRQFNEKVRAGEASQRQ
ncbi:MAG TPA: DUF1572 domain-containing protein [Acidobacteriaceae bacterium]|jgi:hypothetical protein|nr:DUF1572 domain-containing protein [Acidobacteriaceae bacterium]